MFRGARREQGKTGQGRQLGRRLVRHPRGRPNQSLCHLEDLSVKTVGCWRPRLSAQYAQESASAPHMAVFMPSGGTLRLSSLNARAERRAGHEAGNGESGGEGGRGARGTGRSGYGESEERGGGAETSPDGAGAGAEAASELRQCEEAEAAQRADGHAAQRRPLYNLR